MTDRSYNLAFPFWEQARRQPGLLAISGGGSDIRYGELAELGARFAGHVAPRLRTRRVGILATRSVEAYVGILGACMAGATYVPLNLKWPEDRLVRLLGLLELDAIIADRHGAALLTPAVLEAGPATVVLADSAPLPADAAGRTLHRLSQIEATPLDAPVHVGPDHNGYIIFTSGTTGLPKGVMISAASLDHYLAQTRGWTRFTPADRVAETCDVTFDLTVHNLFLALEAGASLHLMSQLEMMAPGRFIRSREITAWMSVPTVINLMRKNGALQPGIFPSLRLSVFCGEPLPVAAVDAWARAAPNGVVENIYGPTECTVVCMRQTLTRPPVVTPRRGILAIGTPYETMEVAILDPAQRPLPAGTPGEIALCGPQVGIGYFAAPEQTADRFRIIDGRRWYLTGDLGMVDDDGIFHHLGRTDNQVKVKGNRIELEEVEMHLRQAAGTELVAAVAWPVLDETPQALVGFVAGTDRTPDDIQAAMYLTLPRYMVPETISVLDALPVNVNGKVDRRALFERLEDEHRDRRVA